MRAPGQVMRAAVAGHEYKMAVSSTFCESPVFALCINVFLSVYFLF